MTDQPLGVGHVLAEGHDAKSCEQCRREAFMRFVVEDILSGEEGDNPPTEFLREVAQEDWDRVLRYFDEHEPETANIIRHGPQHAWAEVLELLATKTREIEELRTSRDNVQAMLRAETNERQLGWQVVDQQADDMAELLVQLANFRKAWHFLSNFIEATPGDFTKAAIKFDLALEGEDD